MPKTLYHREACQQLVIWQADLEGPSALTARESKYLCTDLYAMFDSNFLYIQSLCQGITTVDVPICGSAIW
jgi:hypothetical protein